MYILGLTGSIGMGKSNIARNFKRLRVPVHDADQAVHFLFNHDNRVFNFIRTHFPEAIIDNTINRGALGKIVFDDPEKLRLLESCLHPLVRECTLRFLKVHASCGTPLVVLDIPLLFETKGRDRVDGVLTVSAPLFIQRLRVMSRPGMTDLRFDHIVRQQTPSSVKKHLSEYVIESGLSRAFSFQQLQKILTRVKFKARPIWSPAYR